MRLSQPAEPSSGPTGEPSRALLVGALPGEGWVLAEWLRDLHSGHAALDLVEVDSVESALDVAQHEPLEFCFFGANLGNTQLLRFLRQSRSISRALPVVVLASRADEEAVVSALREGAYDFLLRDGLDRDGVRRVARASVRFGRALDKERQALERARQLELRFRGLAEAMGEGLMHFSSTGTLVTCTPMASALIGAEASLEGKSIEDIAVLFCDAGGDPWPVASFPAVEAYRSGRPVTAHGVVPCGPSPVLALTARARPVFAGDGERPEILMILSVDERESAAADAASRAAGVTHDLSSLLQVVQGGSDLLSRGLDAEHPLRPLAEQLDGAARSAAAMLRKLASPSPMRARPLRPQVLDDSISSARGWLQLVAGADVRIDLHLGAGRALVSFEPDELHRVLLNLVTNAREAMPGGGLVRIATQVVQDDGGAPARLELAVTDSGRGMDPLTQARAFLPDFTTKSSDHRGLGLATVRSIVERWGGSAVLDSGPGRGTRATLLLPLAP